MLKPRVSAAGGFAAIAYTLRKGREADVVTDIGRMRVVAAFIDIPPGNLAMYYPEANAVVPRRVDADSGTPAFKSIVARLEPVRA